MLHNLDYVRGLSDDRRAELSNGKTGTILHEIGHASALNRYGLIPYRLGVHGSERRGFHQKMHTYTMPLEAHDRICAGGILTENYILGKIEYSGKIHDMTRIMLNRDILPDGANIEKAANWCLNQFDDFPTEDEANITIQIHDLFENLWQNLKVHSGYRILPYYKFSHLMNASKATDFLLASIVSRFNLKLPNL